MPTFDGDRIRRLFQRDGGMGGEVIGRQDRREESLAGNNNLGRLGNLGVLRASYLRIF